MSHDVGAELAVREIDISEWGAVEHDRELRRRRPLSGPGQSRDDRGGQRSAGCGPRGQERRAQTGAAACSGTRAERAREIGSTTASLAGSRSRTIASSSPTYGYTFIAKPSFPTDAGGGLVAYRVP
jgi:hypothetical protein